MFIVRFVAPMIIVLLCGMLKLTLWKNEVENVLNKRPKETGECRKLFKSKSGKDGTQLIG